MATRINYRAVVQAVDEWNAQCETYSKCALLVLGVLDAEKKKRRRQSDGAHPGWPVHARPVRGELMKLGALADNLKTWALRCRLEWLPLDRLTSSIGEAAVSVAAWRASQLPLRPLDDVGRIVIALRELALEGVEAEAEEIGRALDQDERKIITTLRRGPKPIAVISEHLACERSAMFGKLKALRGRGVIENVARGQWRLTELGRKVEASIRAEGMPE